MLYAVPGHYPEILGRLHFKKLRKNIRRSRVWISHLHFAICEAFWQFANDFLHFSKNRESLKSDNSWIFRVIHWTAYIVTYFKPTKYHLLNNNVIWHWFIVHIYFKLHTSFLCDYHFVTIYQIVSSWEVLEASNVSSDKKEFYLKSGF